MNCLFSFLFFSTVYFISCNKFIYSSLVLKSLEYVNATRTCLFLAYVSLNHHKINRSTYTDWTLLHDYCRHMFFFRSLSLEPNYCRGVFVFLLQLTSFSLVVLIGRSHALDRTNWFEKFIFSISKDTTQAAQKSWNTWRTYSTVFVHRCCILPTGSCFWRAKVCSSWF